MPKEISFAQKNDFVTRYETENEKHFNKDRELFLKVFPTSPLVAELHKANEFNRQRLDGRMLMELLKSVCFETILENRGIMSDVAKREKTKRKSEEEARKQAEEEALKKAEAMEELKSADLDEIKYKDAKSLIHRLSIDTPDMKGKTIIPALADYKKILESESAKAAENTEETTTEGAEAGAKAGSSDSKKNGDQE
ncbi:MAG: hypothetical protein PF448_13035 [Bacteroidales bacterium]|jgi:hypothetical protein|nr:hypothetical protein [Bacteroidales bacterium]